MFDEQNIALSRQQRTQEYINDGSYQIDQAQEEQEKINEITEEIIGQILKEYPRIQSLDFSHNNLTQIQNLELASQTLLALNLQNNFITFENHFQKGQINGNCLSQLKNLVVLNLSQNMIKDLSNSGIGNLVKLQELDLKQNKISEVNCFVNELRNCQSLKILNMDGNPISNALGFEGLKVVVKEMLRQVDILDGQSILQQQNFAISSSQQQTPADYQESYQQQYQGNDGYQQNQEVQQKNYYFEQESQAMSILQNQVHSLQQIVNSYENQIFKRLQQNYSKSSQSHPLETHEQLCEVWRKKVFDLLVQKRSNELINKQNFESYNQSVKQIQSERDAFKDANLLLETRLRESQEIINIERQQKQALQDKFNSLKKENQRILQQLDSKNSQLRNAEKGFKEIDKIFQSNLQKIENTLTLQISQKVQRISQLEQMIQVFKKTSDWLGINLLKRYSSMKNENEAMKIKISELTFQIDSNVQEQKTSHHLKEQLEQKISDIEQLTEENKILKKQYQNLKSENKDQILLNQSLQAELSALKEMHREAFQDVKRIKSDCAETLLGKEKTTQNKIAELEGQVMDLKFQNQKLLQKIHDIEDQCREQIQNEKDSIEKTLKEKNLQIKQLKSQRDCMFQELQQFQKQKSKSIQQNDGFKPQSSYDFKNMSFKRNDSGQDIQQDDQNQDSNLIDQNISKITLKQQSVQSNFAKFMQNPFMKSGKPIQLGAQKQESTYSSPVKIQNPFMNKSQNNYFSKQQLNGSQRDDAMSQSVQSLDFNNRNQFKLQISDSESSFLQKYDKNSKINNI